MHAYAYVCPCRVLWAVGLFERDGIQKHSVVTAARVESRKAPRQGLQRPPKQNGPEQEQQTLGCVHLEVHLSNAPF